MIRTTFVLNIQGFLFLNKKNDWYFLHSYTVPVPGLFTPSRNSLKLLLTQTSYVKHIDATCKKKYDQFIKKNKSMVSNQSFLDQFHLFHFYMTRFFMNVHKDYTKQMRDNILTYYIRVFTQLCIHRL